jgi:xylulokinase
VPSTDPVLIGIDVGTTTVKAVMAAPGGGVLDRVAVSHPTRRGAPGQAEQDPGDWLGAVRAALHRFAAHRRAGDVAAIGVTSQVNTHLFCDAVFAPLHPALTWQDTRPATVAAGLDARLPLPDRIAALGAPIPIDASHALSRMAWIAATHPDVWQDTAHVMLPKDWIIVQLTGVAWADPLSAVGLVGPDLDYAVPVLELLPRSAGLLPTLHDPVSVAGHVADGPFRGVPVATGTMDAWAAMFGLGVASEGQAMHLSGTSEVLGLISATRTGEPGVVTFPPWHGITLHAGPTQSGGASLDWLARITGQPAEALARLAEGAPVTAGSPLFVPHLDGERAPLWDGRLRGTFAGLSAAIGPAELATAVMEGVACAARMALEAVERSAGRRAAALHHGGGGAQADAWCRVRADVLGRPVTRMATADPGALGAAVMAGVAAGMLPDLAAASAALVRPDRTFDPDPRAAARAEDRFAQFRALIAATTPVSHALSGAGP